MKKHLIKLVFAGVVCFSLSASAQVYVKVRPVAPVVVRTVQPSPAHVWIDEEWAPSGNTYVYGGSRWVAPPQPGYVWVSGHWKRHGRHGEVWVPGHWR